jgi:serine/threonine protein kinase
MAQPSGSNSPLDPSRLTVGGTFGRYVIVDLLGFGSLGSTYLAWDPLLHRQVMLKIPDFAGSDAPAHRTRFLREAHVAARLDHPDLCPVFDVGEVDGILYLVRAFIAGEPLSNSLRGGKELSRHQVVATVVRLALAWEKAHSLGVLHLNLKPSNILLDPRRGPVILDFGIGRGINPNAGPPINTAALLWWWPYMPPEQYPGDANAIGPASDVYSLGVILYELLSGRLPFEGPATAVMAQVLTSEPSPPSTFRSDLDSNLDAVCLKAIARRIEDRYSSMREMAAVLERWLTRSPKDPRAGRLRLSMREMAAVLERWLTRSPKDPRAGRPRPFAPAPSDRDAAPPATLGRTLPEVSPSPERPIVSDEDVQFTVYRPRTVRPGAWYELLAFAHLSRRRADAPADEPDPIEEVRRQAELLLAERGDDYHDVTQDSRQAVPREGEITFLPEIPGFEFNPPRRIFRWIESLHSEHFRFRASDALDGQTARGRLTVFLGGIILAEVTLSIRVDRRHVVPPTTSAEVAQADHARPYRKIFASYSHKDIEIVRQFELFAWTLGDEYLRDGVNLRSGQVWNDRLKRMIHEADIFQLFWSTNAMRSPYVREEWEYALSLGRHHFVRPTYWEDPLPSSPHEHLPPEALLRLHFQRVLVPLGGSATLDPETDLGGRVSPASPPSVASQGSTDDHPPDPFQFDLESAPSEPPPAPSPPLRRSKASGVAAIAGLVLLVGAGVWYQQATRTSVIVLRSPALGSVRLELADPELIVSIDGERIGAELLRGPIALRAGTHLMQILRGNEIVETRTLQIRPGGRELVSVESRPVSVGPRPETDKVPRGPGTSESDETTVATTATDDLHRELAELAKQVKALLDQKGNDAIAMGDFRGPARLASSAGTAIAKALADDLQKLGVIVRRGAALEVNGEYRDVEDQETRRLAIEIKARVVDRSGTEVVAFQPRGVFAETPIAALTGISASLPPDRDDEERNKVLARALDDPKVHVAGTRIAAQPDSPYAIEILVKSGADYRPRAASVNEEGFATLTMRPGEIFEIKLINDSANDVAVALSIDALSVFAFSENTKYTRWFVPSHQSVTVSGWYRTNGLSDAFKVAEYAQVAAAERLPSPKGMGTITASFAAAWPRGTLPPEDELAGHLGGRSGHATAAGPPVTSNFAEQVREVGRIRAAVSVRYTTDERR